MTRIKGEMNHQRQLTYVVQLVPIELSLGVVLAVKCPLTARQVLCLFILGDGNANPFLARPCPASVSSSASFAGRPTLLVDASE
jgi:hypothetical protein